MSRSSRLEKDIAEYKRLGVRILGVYPPCLQGEVYENHPDWRRIATDTTEIPQIDMKKYPHGGMLCLLGPYGDFFIDVLAEILTQYPDVDAFSFDGLHYGGVCYCRHCRANYRKDAGAGDPQGRHERPGLPPLSALGRPPHGGPGPADAERGSRGSSPTSPSSPGRPTPAGSATSCSIPRNMPARMNLLLDAPDQEFWLDETNRGTTIVPAFANAYIWATTNHRVGLQRAVHPEPRQPLRQGQLPAAGDPPPDAADADLRRRRRASPSASRPTCSRSSTTASTRSSGASRG